MKQTVALVIGYPASGKSTATEKMFKDGFARLNRDIEGGKLEDLLPKLDALLSDGKSVVLDNTYATIAKRAGVIEIAKKHNIPIECYHMQTTIEEAQFNACKRMIERHGKILTPEEINKSKDPNMIPTAVLFKFKKEFEKPTTDEGFSVVRKINFVRQLDSSYSQAALILDYDGTLRQTINGNDKYPVKPEQVAAMPRRKEVLALYKKKGYLLLGASNQSGIAKGELTEQNAIDCFEQTNKLIGHKVEYSFCPHRIPPLTCYCRKPMCGLGVTFIEKYKLNPNQCIMVGNATSDKTFSSRCGFQYVDQAEFFA